jgi:putative DNA primase/helicase
MTGDVLEICRTCGRRPSRLAIVGESYRIRCGCGVRFEQVFGDSSEIGEPRATPTTREIDTLGFIRSILNESRPAANTVVKTYLESRGIKILSPVLRLAERLRHVPSDSWFPAMVAPIVDVHGQLVGLHRTFLALDGSSKAAVKPTKMMLGRCSGGSVRLADASPEFGVSEGIESGLAAMQETGIPIWAALSTSGLRALVLPKSIKKVIIFADADEKGLEAARSAAARWYAEGRRVSIVRPVESGSDFNDLIERRA